MSLIEVNWNPKRKELRNFAMIALIASVLVASLLYIFKGVRIQWAAIIFAAGFGIFLSSFMSLKLTRIMYLGLILVTLPIGWVVSLILLAAFYFLLLAPLGLLFRLLGRDPLSRRFDPAAKSYWLSRREPESLDRYFHQF
ncbi:MAG TPA: SxtJ family membrane protein [Sedimentisphaerales bacterium]|nr:SxtJ family membrane protein [Sedimentisphaerales bacterium]